jgi:glycosyltransferase involved in cell wall biosynthesis
MHILMLSQFYPPIIGGVEQHVRTLSIELVARGHNVAVITLWHKGLAEFEQDQGVRVYRIRSSLQRLPRLFNDNGRQYAAPFPDPEITLALRRIIIKERPEIVHAHNWLVHSFLPLKGWSGARLIVTLHSYDMVCANTDLLYRDALCEGPGITKCFGCAMKHYGLVKGIPTVLSNRVMSLIERDAADMFVAVSQAVAVGNGLVDEQLPFQVIPNFIPNFMPDDVNMPQGDSEPYLAQLPAEDYLLFVGALNRQKGVKVLLRAYAHLTHAPPLVLIGYQTPEWPILALDCPNNVFVLKNWPRYAVMQAWRRSLIALAPSVGPEASPTVVMEAMSAKCPVIASRIGGLIDLIADGETGFLIEPGDSSALQHSIELLLTNPDLRNRMGLAAREKIIDFQAQKVVPRIEHVYEKVLL